VRISGATLWSNVPGGATAREVSRAMNDYYRVYMPAEIGGKKSVRKLTVDDTNAMFSSDLAFIQRELKEASKLTDDNGSCQRAVVLTHHAPTETGTSDPAYNKSPVKCAFATPLEYMFDHTTTLGKQYQALTAWAFGHTHWSVDIKVKDVRVVANQHGYKGEKVGAHVPSYSNKFTIVV